MRKKLAIISSYNVTCGNASYTHALKEEFTRHYDTTILAIDYKLLTNPHRVARKLAQKHLADIAGQLKNFDYVNIQYEAGIFGYSAKSAGKNVSKLIKASKNLLFTIHRVSSPQMARPLWRSVIKHKLNYMKILREVDLSLQGRAFDMLMQVLRNKCARKGKTRIMVHTRREADMLKLYYGLTEVVDFPLTFLTKAQIQEATSNRERIRKEVYQKYELDQNAKYVGIFGFLSENKGHHILVDAMKYLPDNYRLAIFGAQHPMAIQEYDLASALKNQQMFHANNNSYISSLIELVHGFLSEEQKTRKNPLPVQEQRIRFLGGLDDENFIRAITAMDYVVVPYFETGQGGSGNASLILELQSKAVFSRTHAFLELARYYPNCFEITDIGNPIEIAQKIMMWNSDFSVAQKKATAVYNIENNILVHKKTFEEGSVAATALKKELARQGGF